MSGKVFKPEPTETPPLVASVALIEMWTGSGWQMVFQKDWPENAAEAIEQARKDPLTEFQWANAQRTKFRVKWSQGPQEEPQVGIAPGATLITGTVRNPAELAAALTGATSAPLLAPPLAPGGGPLPAGGLDDGPDSVGKSFKLEVWSPKAVGGPSWIAVPPPYPPGVVEVFRELEDAGKSGSKRFGIDAGHYLATYTHAQTEEQLVKETLETRGRAIPGHDDGGAAFPRPLVSLTEEQAVDGLNDLGAEGMTLLDYFAGKACEGMLSAMSDPDIVTLPKPEDVARYSYAVARAMLAEKKVV